MRFRTSILLLVPLCIAAALMPPQTILFETHGTALTEGGFYRSEWIDRSAGTYSVSKVRNDPPPFASLHFHRWNEGYFVVVDDFEHDVASFGLRDDGRLMTNSECHSAHPGYVCDRPCIKDVCLTRLKVLDSRTFIARIGDGEVKYESIVGLKESRNARP